MDEEEEWAEIFGYPNYSVSNYGDVRNHKTGRLLRQRHNGRGYLRVTLYNDGGSEEHYVHHLVAIAFLRGFRRGLSLKHDNEDKTDNRVSNLIVRNRRPQRVHHRSNREPYGKPVKIRETGEVYRTVRDCARAIHGDYSSIYAVLRGDRSHHLGFTFEYLET